MTSSHEPLLVPHERQDRLATVALAANDLSGRERDRAAAHLVVCEACRTLLADIAMISAAVQALPPTGRSPERDFRLAPRDASRLAGGATWRRLLRPFGGVRNPVVRPLAATLMTLGLAAFVLSAQPFLQLSAVGTQPHGAAPGPERASTVPQKATVEGTGPANVDTGEATSPPANVSGGGYPNGGSSPGPSGDAKGAAASESPRSTTSGGTIWPFLSLVFLGTGAGVLLLRRIAVRIR